MIDLSQKSIRKLIQSATLLKISGMEKKRRESNEMKNEGVVVVSKFTRSYDGGRIRVRTDRRKKKDSHCFKDVMCNS